MPVSVLPSMKLGAWRLVAILWQCRGVSSSLHLSLSALWTQYGQYSVVWKQKPNCRRGNERIEMMLTFAFLVDRGSWTRSWVAKAARFWTRQLISQASPCTPKMHPQLLTAKLNQPLSARTPSTPSTMAPCPNCSTVPYLQDVPDGGKAVEGLLPRTWQPGSPWSGIRMTAPASPALPPVLVLPRCPANQLVALSPSLLL